MKAIRWFRPRQGISRLHRDFRQLRCFLCVQALLLTLTACGSTDNPQSVDFGNRTGTASSIAEGETAAASLSEDAITDDSGEFVYDGKLDQIGDDENGYIKVPLGFVRFQDEDVEGLTQASDVTGKNIVTLDCYPGIDYQTAANQFRAYMEAQENLEGLTGATVTVGGYQALQLYGHYTDGYFIVVWLIEDPDNPSDTYYLAMEFDSDHQYLIACSSTFQTPSDHSKENP